MRKVFVGSLSWNTTEDSLGNFFSTIGDVEEAIVIKDHNTGRSRGFGFVVFSEVEAANKAVEELDGKELDGRTIKVNIAKERTNRDHDRGGNRRSFNNNRQGDSRGY